MRKLFVIVMLAGIAGSWAVAQPSAPGAYQPPVSSKTALDAALHPLPQDEVASYLYTYEQVHSFDVFAGKNAALKEAAEASESKVKPIGAGVAVDLAPQDLFGQGVTDGAGRSFAAAIESEGALALRLVVDLSALADGDEVFVLDPTATRAFGPFTRDDHIEGGRWLPTTEGAWCVLLARTAGTSAPPVTLKAFTHIYQSLDDLAKVLSCNINIACEEDTRIQEVSSGVGLLVVPMGTYDAGLCTCSLINNADTPAYEPYALTSNHCVPEAASAAQVDVLWDYRADTCGEDDAPTWGSVPRSHGDVLLASDSGLDITLFRVNSVPGGAFGRYYLGWTARDLLLGEAVVDIHHPDVSHMRISYGDVLRKGLSHALLLYHHQNEMIWRDGVTEGGSSGSPLLLVNEDYAIGGTLSNGPVHVCGGAFNTDRFSSFADFFDSAEGFLTGDDPPDPQDPTGLCPAKDAFKAYPEMLAQLRAFRDKGLMKSAFGQRLVALYYKNGPAMTKAVQRSPQARALFFLAASPFAQAGKSLR